jgi:iron(III) transport system ATP-binding protein
VEEAFRVSNPAPYLQIRSVTKTFGKFVALQDIDLDVQEGEFVCLLGPSGCGKTTLLRIVAGLEEPTAGTIVQGGQDITHRPPSQRDFGIVFQSYALFPNLTVAQNVAYGLHNRRMPGPAIESRVRELLTLVGLPELHHRYPAQLSGGQQQRVALARALALSPGLLLLDEPLSALDARVRANLRGEVAALQRRLRVTTLMVTHDQEEALTMADRIVVMDHGRIVQVGTPAEVYNLPATPFVADFVGQMNFLPGFVAQPDRLQLDGCPVALEVQSGIGDLAPGSPVTLAIRPEEVEVLDREHPVPNTFTVSVEDVEFLGPFYRVRLNPALDLATPCGVQIVAHLSPGGTEHGSLQRGTRLFVHLPAHRLRVFPAATAQPEWSLS